MSLSEEQWDGIVDAVQDSFNRATGMTFLLRQAVAQGSGMEAEELRSGLVAALRETAATLLNAANAFEGMPSRHAD